MCYNNSIRYLDVSISIENNKTKNVYKQYKKRRFCNEKKITFYIGLQDKDTKTELIKYDEAYKIIANRLDAFIIQKAHGCYQYDDGSLCFENTLIVTIFENYSDEYIKVLVNNFKLDFNQERVGLEIVHNCNINFI